MFLSISEYSRIFNNLRKPSDSLVIVAEVPLKVRNVRVAPHDSIREVFYRKLTKTTHMVRIQTFFVLNVILNNEVLKIWEIKTERSSHIEK